MKQITVPHGFAQKDKKASLIPRRNPWFIAIVMRFFCFRHLPRAVGCPALGGTMAKPAAPLKERTGWSICRGVFGQDLSGFLSTTCLEVACRGTTVELFHCSPDDCPGREPETLLRQITSAGSQELSNGVCLKLLQRNHRQRVHMRGYKIDPWRNTGQIRLFPASYTQAPTVTGLESGELVFRSGRHQVVTPRLRIR